jgi:hypothetical protein
MGTRPFTVVALIVLVLIGCATLQPLAPGQLFPGPLINVRAPASGGWQLVKSGAEGMAFGRDDASAGNTYIAQVTAFRLPPFSTPDELLAIVEAGAAKDSPTDRFKVVDANFQLTNERPYPCVRFRGSSEDLKARTRQGTAALLLHIRSLYCQHPTQRDLGLLIAYSQRVGPPDPDLDTQAQSFIDGVRVPQER